MSAEAGGLGKVHGWGKGGKEEDWQFATETRAIPAFSLGLGVANSDFLIALYVTSCFGGEGSHLFQW